MAISGRDTNNAEKEILVDTDGRVLTGTSYEVTAPVAQTTTNDPAVLAGAEIDARDWLTVSYTVSVATNTITWWVYGANLATYAGEVIVSGPTDVVAGATSAYAVTPAPYGFYRVKVDSKVDASFGSVTCVGITKK
jgi:hypothetical protein